MIIESILHAVEMQMVGSPWSDRVIVWKPWACLSRRSGNLGTWTNRSGVL